MLKKWANTHCEYIFKVPSFPPLQNRKCIRIGPRHTHTKEHIFDGYGYISIIDFKQDHILIKTKRIETIENKIEKTLNTRLFKGVFTENEDAPLYIKTPANTNLKVLNDNTILALNDGGFAHTIDMKSNKIAKKLWFTPHYSAHYVTLNDITYFFSISISEARTTIYIYKTKNIHNPQLIDKIELPYFTYIHDFRVTQNYFIFYVNPLKYIKTKDTDSIFSNIKLDKNKKGVWLLINRVSGQQLMIPNLKTNNYPIIMHHINAYEQENTGNIIINSICINDINFNSRGGVFKFNINPKKMSCEQTILSITFGEFPIYNKQYVYYLTNPNTHWFTSITRLHLKCIDEIHWNAPEFVLLNECTYINDFVVVVGYHYNDDISILFILDKDLNLLYKHNIPANIGFALHTVGE